MERETGFEPATSSLGIKPFIEFKPLARFCCEFLNLQRLAKSAFSKPFNSNEAQTRHDPTLLTGLDRDCRVAFLDRGKQANEGERNGKIQAGPVGQPAHSVQTRQSALLAGQPLRQPLPIARRSKSKQRFEND